AILGKGARRVKCALAGKDPVYLGGAVAAGQADEVDLRSGFDLLDVLLQPRFLAWSEVDLGVVKQITRPCRSSGRFYFAVDASGGGLLKGRARQRIPGARDRSVDHRLDLRLCRRTGGEHLELSGVDLDLRNRADGRPGLVVRLVIIGSIRAG